MPISSNLHPASPVARNVPSRNAQCHLCLRPKFAPPCGLRQPPVESTGEQESELPETAPRRYRRCLSAPVGESCHTRLRRETSRTLSPRRQPFPEPTRPCQSGWLPE